MVTESGRVRGAAAVKTSWDEHRSAIGATTSACEKGTAWKMAADMVSHMMKQGIRLDEVCISAMVSALENCSRC